MSMPFWKLSFERSVEKIEQFMWSSVEIIGSIEINFNLENCTELQMLNITKIAEHTSNVGKQFKIPHSDSDPWRGIVFHELEIVVWWA